MKRILLFTILVYATLSGFSQSQWYYYAEEFYFVKEVSVKEFRGKNFRYEIAVRENPSDTLSKVRIHGINVGKGKEEYINSDFALESRKEQEWTIYSIVGVVDNAATRLWFYSAVNGNGNFYFDDLSFYIEQEPGRWKQVVLPNTSFETKSRNIFDGFYVSKRSSRTLTTQVSNSVYKTGKRSLEVISTQQQPASLLTTTLK
ncbi:MAG: hypothetical protein ACKVOW_07325 [Chitinophagaceae bacterium]